jgi:hypothetical protein
MTTRRWLVAVAVVAVPLAVWDEIVALQQRRLDYELRALDHGLAAQVYGRDSEELPVVYCFSPPPPSDPRKAAYHAALAHKWMEAARWPWLPVAPDPPEPRSVSEDLSLINR